MVRIHAEIEACEDSSFINLFSLELKLLSMNIAFTSITLSATRLRSRQTKAIIELNDLIPSHVKRRIIIKV